MFLAAKMRMTRARLRREMSNAEYVDWQAYYTIQAQHIELAKLKAG
jgi:hypothetical protein